jgi:hypothetical protein
LLLGFRPSAQGGEVDSKRTARLGQFLARTTSSCHRQHSVGARFDFRALFLQGIRLEEIGLHDWHQPPELCGERFQSGPSFVHAALGQVDQGRKVQKPTQDIISAMLA